MMSRICSRVYSRVVARHHSAPVGRFPLVGALVGIAALVAGCGGSNSSASHVTPTPETVAYTCPAGQTSMGIPSNAVVIKGSDSQHDATVQVGQTVVVELSPQLRWSYDPAASTAHNLTAQDPTGALDSAVNVCFWQWQAQSTGTAQLTFRGQPNCQASQQNCPALTPGAGGASPGATVPAGTNGGNAGSNNNNSAPNNPGPYTYVSQMRFTIHVQ